VDAPESNPSGGYVFRKLVEAGTGRKKAGLRSPNRQVANKIKFAQKSASFLEVGTVEEYHGLERIARAGGLKPN
jgi:hypothetical protein